MIKNLRKLFMILFMAFVAVANAQEVVFNFNETTKWSDNVYANVNTAKTSASGTNIAGNVLEKEGVKLLFTNNATTETCISSQYGGGCLYSVSTNVVTMQAPEGKVIKGFEAVCANNFGFGINASAATANTNITPVGVWERNPNNAAPYLVRWTAPANATAEVVFTLNANLIWTKLTITLADDPNATPAVTAPSLGIGTFSVKNDVTLTLEELANGVQLVFYNASDEAKEAAAHGGLFVEAMLSIVDPDTKEWTPMIRRTYSLLESFQTAALQADLFHEAFGDGEVPEPQQVADSYRIEITKVFIGSVEVDPLDGPVYTTAAEYDLEDLGIAMPLTFNVEKSSASESYAVSIGTPKAEVIDGEVWVTFEGNNFVEQGLNDDWSMMLSDSYIDGEWNPYYPDAAFGMDMLKSVRYSNKKATPLSEGEHTLVLSANSITIFKTDPVTWVDETLYTNAEPITLTFTVGGEEEGGETKSPVTVTADAQEGLAKIYVQFNDYAYADAGDYSIDLTNLSTFAVYSAEPWGVIDDSNNTVEYRIYETLPDGKYEVVINQGSALVSNSPITYSESEYCSSYVAELTIGAEEEGGNEGGEGDVPTKTSILTADGTEITDGATLSTSTFGTVLTVNTVPEVKNGYMYVFKLFPGSGTDESNWTEGEDEYVATVTVDDAHKYTATFPTAIPAGQYRFLCRVVDTNTWDWLVDIEYYITLTEATSISSINVENGKVVMYNLAGQRVNNAKGIVIVNGKKMMVK